MLRAIIDNPGEFNFYFTKDDIEYDICLRRFGNYYFLYLNYYQSIHNNCDDVTVFIEPLNEMLDLLPYIDGFNECLNIYIIDKFNDHRDLIKYLSLEKQTIKIKIPGYDSYLVKKGKVKQLDDWL